MPNTKSAKKRLKQSEGRRLRNRGVRSTLKSQIKKVRDAVEAKDVPKAEAEARLTATKLDRAAARKVIHPNAAARTKSRLQSLIKTAKGK